MLHHVFMILLFDLQFLWLCCNWLWTVRRNWENEDI